MDRDGYPDLLVGTPTQTCGAYPERGAVVVFSGRTGNALHTLIGEPGDGFGHDVGNAGDVDADGHSDFVYSAIGDAGNFVRIHSGKTGAKIRDYHTTHNGADGFGWSIENAGDVDRDGVPDLVVGARELLAIGTGLVHVYSGRSGIRLHALAGTGMQSGFGTAVGRAGDADRDGYADFFAVTGSTGLVQIFSGRTGSVLQQVASGWKAAESAAGLGDVNGDGIPDLAVAAPPVAGVRFYSARPLTLCTDVHRLSVVQGGTQHLLLERGRADSGKLYLLLGSTSGIRPGLHIGRWTLPLAAQDPWFRLTLAHPGQVLQSSFGALGAGGTATVPFTLLPGLARGLESTVFHHAWMLLDPRTFEVLGVSNAAPLRLE